MKIWFIENCYVNLEEIKDSLQKMKDKNWFAKVSCFMIGRGKIGLNKEFKLKENANIEYKNNRYKLIYKNKKS